MAKYVPPSRRQGYVPLSSSDLPPPTIQPRGRGDGFRRGAPRGPGGFPAGRPGLYSPADLSRHFTHPQNSTFTFFSYHIPYVPRPRIEYDPSRTPLTTPLPPSPPPPPLPHPLRHLVSYIVIFHKAHPAWDTERELWTHTNADVLIKDWQGSKKNFGRPIPVFRFDRVQMLFHVFEGWFILQDLRIVEPHSPELKELLEAKEKDKNYRGGRSAEAWAMSMRDTWIKIKLVPAEPSGEHYPELKDIMSITGDGEAARYMLKVGGLSEELSTLEGAQLEE